MSSRSPGTALVTLVDTVSGVSPYGTVSPLPGVLARIAAHVLLRRPGSARPCRGALAIRRTEDRGRTNGSRLVRKRR